MKTQERNQILTVKEAAVRLRVSASLVYQLVERGEIACHRVGKRHRAIRIRESDLIEYLASCRSERCDTPQRPPPVRLRHLKL